MLEVGTIQYYKKFHVTIPYIVKNEFLIFGYSLNMKKFFPMDTILNITYDFNLKIKL